MPIVCDDLSVTTQVFPHVKAGQRYWTPGLWAGRCFVALWKKGNGLLVAVLMTAAGLVMAIGLAAAERGFFAWRRSGCLACGRGPFSCPPPLPEHRIPESASVFYGDETVKRRREPSCPCGHEGSFFQGHDGLV